MIKTAEKVVFFKELNDKSYFNLSTNVETHLEKNYLFISLALMI